MNSFQVLDLSQNEFHHLGRNPFIGQVKLRELNLSSNQVTSLSHKRGSRSHTFRGPVNLQTLDLSHNLLTSLDNRTFSDLKQLVELKLRSNKLQRISPSAFSGLARLRMLHLDSNLLETLDRSWLEPLQSLRFLYLSENRFSQLSAKTFQPLIALRVVDLSANRLISVEHGTFTRSLDTLDLSHNLLSDVPTLAMAEAQKLKHLDLSSNPIEQIGPNAFQNLYDLESLKLNYLRDLTSISGHALLDNVRLADLSLENCPELQPLSYGVFASNTLLKTVGFRNNSWATLSPNQVPINSIRELRVSGLPFTCNCSLIWLWHLYQVKYLKVQYSTMGFKGLNSFVTLNIFRRTNFCIIFFLIRFLSFSNQKDFMFSPGIEPGTFCVLDRCDNHYTTKTVYDVGKISSKLTLVMTCVIYTCYVI